MIKVAPSPYFFVALTFIFTSLPVDSKVFFLEADFYQDKTQVRNLILGKGEVIKSDKPVVRVVTSDPSISDLQMLTEKQVFVRAKRLGICTILVWEKEAKSPTRFDVTILPDLDYLTKQLQELDKNITVEYIPPAGESISGSDTGVSSSQAPTGTGPAGGAGQDASGALSAAGAPTTAESSTPSTGRIILKGEVVNAEVIARALQVAGAYVGDQGIRIISQPGGQIVNGLAGEYNIDSNSDSEGGQSGTGSATAFGSRNPIQFTSNRYANLSRGVIATTQNGSVISFLTIKDPPQISVAIRFYEIQRSTARNLGFNTIFGGHTLQGGTFIGGTGVSRPIGSVSATGNLTGFMISGGAAPELAFGGRRQISDGAFILQQFGEGVTSAIFNPSTGIGAVIQALQERGEIKTLAEPNLVIANGEPASFLAGGEVPIIRSVFTAGGASQDVTYEPFGIRFNILPTVTKGEMIFLQLVPEIRDIDNALSNFVVPPGSTSVRPPAFKTRRTQTQVELESGQAIAISGLLREDNTRNLRKVPGIGDIPVLGSLFRSKSFQKGQSELLIVVSPQIIRPTTPDKIAKNLSVPEIPYSDFDQFAPIHPYFNKHDEKGPEMRDPLDAGKYHSPTTESPPDEYQEPQNIPPPGEENKDKSLEEEFVKKEQYSLEKSSVDQLPNKETEFRKKIEADTPTKKLLNEKEEGQNKKLQAQLDKQAKLIERQKYLSEELKRESIRYSRAKKAMELARQTKL